MDLFRKKTGSVVAWSPTCIFEMWIAVLLYTVIDQIYNRQCEYLRVQSVEKLNFTAMKNAWIWFVSYFCCCFLRWGWCTFEWTHSIHWWDFFFVCLVFLLLWVSVWIPVECCGGSIGGAWVNALISGFSGLVEGAGEGFRQKEMVKKG